MERNVGRSDIMVNTEMVGLHTIKQNGGTPYRQQTLKQWGLFFLALNGKKCWKIRYYGKY